MPFFDQHWWLRWLGTGLAGVAAVLLPLRYIQVAALYDHLLDWNMWPDLVYAGMIALTLLGAAIFLARSARRARARLQWRIGILTAGDHPTRRQTTTGNEAEPAAPQEGVITLQRIDLSDRVIGWLYVPLFLGSILLSVALLAMVVNFFITPTASAFVSADSAPMPMILYVLLVPLIAAGSWTMSSVTSAVWASPPSFELDEFGITRITARGKRLTIRWQEARLLEMVERYQPEGRTLTRQAYFLLYGNDTVVRMDPKRNFSPELMRLLGLIEDYSGLIPLRFNQREGVSESVDALGYLRSSMRRAQRWYRAGKRSGATGKE